MKTKTTPTTKPTVLEAKTPDTTTTLVASREGLEDIATYLLPNPNKTTAMHPTLVGMTKFDSLAVNLAAWGQETMDGQRYYYTLAITDGVKWKQAMPITERRLQVAHTLFNS